MRDARTPPDRDAAYRELELGWIKPTLREMARSPYLVQQMNESSTTLIVKGLMASMPAAFAELKARHYKPTREQLAKALKAEGWTAVRKRRSRAAS